MCFVTGALAWWAPEFVAYSQSIYYDEDITENDRQDFFIMLVSSSKLG